MANVTPGMESSWLTGPGYFSVNFEPPRVPVAPKETPWLKLTNLAALTPQLRGKIEAVLAYTFGVHVATVSKYLSDLSCVEWSETPKFVDDMPKCIRISETCFTLWKDFFNALPQLHASDVYPKPRVSLILADVSSNFITQLGTLNTVKKLWITIELPKVLESRIELRQLSAAWIKTPYAYVGYYSEDALEKNEELKHLSVYKHKYKVEVKVDDYKVPISNGKRLMYFGPNPIAHGAPSTIYGSQPDNVMMFVQQDPTYASYTSTSRSVKCTPTYFPKEKLPLRHLFIDNPKESFNVPRAVADFFQFPDRRHIHYEKRVMTFFGPRVLSEGLLRPKLSPYNFSAPVLPTDGLDAVCYLFRVAAEEFKGEKFALHLLDFLNSGHTLYGFRIYAETTAEFLESLFPVTVKHKLSGLDFTHAPPVTDALVPLFDKFSEHTIHGIVLTRPLTQREQLAFAAKSQEILDRHPKFKTYLEFVSYEVNPYNYHHEFFPFVYMLSERQLKWVGLKSKQPTCVAKLNFSGIDPSLKALGNFQDYGAIGRDEEQLRSFGNAVVTPEGVGRANMTIHKEPSRVPPMRKPGTTYPGVPFVPPVVTPKPTVAPKQVPSQPAAKKLPPIPPAKAKQVTVPAADVKQEVVAVAGLSKEDPEALEAR